MPALISASPERDREIEKTYLAAWREFLSSLDFQMGPRSRTEEAVGAPVAPEKLTSLPEVGEGIGGPRSLPAFVETNKKKENLSAVCIPITMPDP